MKPLKFPLVSTLVLYALAGAFALHAPLPGLPTASDFISKASR